MNLPPLTEFQIMQIVKDGIQHAKSQGDVHASIPVWMLEKLIEKAERPHD